MCAVQAQCARANDARRVNRCQTLPCITCASPLQPCPTQTKAHRKAKTLCCYAMLHHMPAIAPRAAACARRTKSAASNSSRTSCARRHCALHDHAHTKVTHMSSKEPRVPARTACHLRVIDARLPPGAGRFCSAKPLRNDSRCCCSVLRRELTTFRWSTPFHPGVLTGVGGAAAGVATGTCCCMFCNRAFGPRRARGFAFRCEKHPRQARSPERCGATASTGGLDRRGCEPELPWRMGDTLAEFTGLAAAGLLGRASCCGNGTTASGGGVADFAGGAAARSGHTQSQGTAPCQTICA